jgi:CNT family concentrative nucleoside transporter
MAFTLGFDALPLILVISALSRLFYHWGILQRVVAVFAWLFQRSLGVSGPVGTAAAANVFVGMIESPLLIKPYLASMSRSGVFAMMSVGMAGIAGTVLAVYATILGPHVPGAAGHLIVASVISAPAALMLAQIMIPETATIGADQPTSVTGRDTASSSMDAIAQGTREGIDLFANVVAMLIVAVALVALANMVLAFSLAPLGVSLTFQQGLGVLFAPLAWLTGIPAAECLAAGGLLGIKTVLNEFVAYLQLAASEPATFSERSRLILTYALCGFANFGSLGILVGALSSMVPERRAEFAGLGVRTIASGTLATLMTASIVGLMTPG